jgi:hypothetical protein
MPRRRPGALRAQSEFRVRQWTYELGPVDRLSPDTSAAIHFAERSGHGYHTSPGRTSSSLYRYRAFLGQPGTRLRLVVSDMPACPGCAYLDVAWARDALEAVAVLLPSRARAELRRLLWDLDTELRRRTLPNPDSRCHVDWRGEPARWWHRRMYVGD